MRKFLNYALFQAGWFAVVLTAGTGRPRAALAAAVTAVALSLWFSSTDRMRDLRLILVVALIGFCIDTLNLHLGVFARVDASRFPLLCPLWLVGLWALLASTLRSSLGWLAGRYGLSAVLGAMAGPLSYVGGVKFGAAAMPADRIFSVVVMAALWAVAMPLIVWLAHGRHLLTETRESAV